MSFSIVGRLGAGIIVCEEHLEAWGLLTGDSLVRTTWPSQQAVIFCGVLRCFTRHLVEDGLGILDTQCIAMAFDPEHF